MDKTIEFVIDGNMWCARRPDFINLQESIAGFGTTQEMAQADLEYQEDVQGV